MSCYPPRDPRLRYPAHHHAPPQRTAKQPLTFPISSSGRYTKRQSMQDPVSARSVSYGHALAVQPERNRQKQRIVSDSGCYANRDLGCAKDDQHLSTQRYRQHSAVDHHRDWVDGYPSRHAPDTTPTTARSIRNGTDRTSYKVNTLPPRNRTTEKPLPRVYEHSICGGESVSTATDEGSSRKKQREGTCRQDDPPSSRGQYHAPSSSEGTGRSISIKPPSPGDNPSSATGISSDRKHEPKDHPRRSEREISRTVAAEPVRKEGMDVDEVEEEITCPICMSILVGATSAVPCGHVFCASCGLSWIRDHDRCPICRERLAEPLTNAFVHMRMIDSLVGKWVAAKGQEWDGLEEWKERCAAWDAQRVVWREDLEAIAVSRKAAVDTQGSGGSSHQDMAQTHGHEIPSPPPVAPWNPFTLSGDAPLLHSLFAPDPISAFLDRMASHHAVENLLRNTTTRPSGLDLIDALDSPLFTGSLFNPFAMGTTPNVLQRQGRAARQS